MKNKRFIVSVCQEPDDFAEIEDLLNGGYRIKRSDVMTCGDSTYIVYVLEAEENIVSVKSVDLNEVDKLLSEGYEVRELYAKNATLVKVEQLEKGVGGEKR